MKTLRIVILEDRTSAPTADEGWSGLDLRQLEGLSGNDAAALLRQHAQDTAFVDTAPDTLVDLPDLQRFESDLQAALHATLQTAEGGTPTLLMGTTAPRRPGPEPERTAGTEVLPFERLNRSLVRALRRHELEAALAESHRRLRRMDPVDPSLGMPSRELFLDRLEQAAAAVMRGGVSFATLVIGVELPTEPPALRHDRRIASLLRVMGDRLVQSGRRSDSCTRLGGHSFAALLPGNHTVGGALAMAHKVARALGQPVRLEGGQMLHPRPAVGVALCPQHGTDARSVLLHAHAAMEQAQQSRDGVALFDARLQRSLPVTVPAASPAMPWPGGVGMVDGSVRPDESLAPLLAAAIERREFSVAYQPVMRLRDGLAPSMAGADAVRTADPTGRHGLRRLSVLPRWHAAGRGHVAPAVFMPVAEHHALASVLTDQLLDLALGQARPWREAGWIEALSMPLSTTVLEDADFPERLERLLLRHAWPAAALLLEVTAAALAQPGAIALQVLDAIARLGVRLSVQDLGSPLHTGLTLAERGTLVEVRLDLASLVAPVPAACPQAADTPTVAPARPHHSARDTALVRSAVLLAQALGAELLVSGVADLATAGWLCDLGCTLAQGSAWGWPLPADQVRSWLAG